MFFFLRNHSLDYGILFLNYSNWGLNASLNKISLYKDEKKEKIYRSVHKIFMKDNFSEVDMRRIRKSCLSAKCGLNVIWNLDIKIFIVEQPFQMIPLYRFIVNLGFLRLLKENIVKHRFLLDSRSIKSTVTHEEFKILVKFG